MSEGVAAGRALKALRAVRPARKAVCEEFFRARVSTLLCQPVRVTVSGPRLLLLSVRAVAGACEGPADGWASVWSM